MDGFLSAEVAAKFQVVNTHCPRVLNTPIGDIDFATLTLDQAEVLVAGGFYYLERVPPKPPRNSGAQNSDPEKV